MDSGVAAICTLPAQGRAAAVGGQQGVIVHRRTAPHVGGPSSASRTVNSVYLLALVMSRSRARQTSRSVAQRTTSTHFARGLTRAHPHQSGGTATVGISAVTRLTDHLLALHS